MFVEVYSVYYTYIYIYFLYIILHTMWISLSVVLTL